MVKDLGKGIRELNCFGVATILVVNKDRDRRKNKDIFKLILISHVRGRLGIPKILKQYKHVSNLYYFKIILSNIVTSLKNFRKGERIDNRKKKRYESDWVGHFDIQPSTLTSCLKCVTLMTSL